MKGSVQQQFYVQDKKKMILLMMRNKGDACLLACYWRLIIDSCRVHSRCTKCVYGGIYWVENFKVQSDG